MKNSHTAIKKLLFISGTRADFGKIKPLIKVFYNKNKFQTGIFVTGMHTLTMYGYTADEIFKSFKQGRLQNGLRKIHIFHNQNTNDDMDTILSKTIVGLADYVKEFKPNLIIVHGDRVEALGAAIVGVLNNIKVAHIEGGELSGTVDESLRHSISKLSHKHFTSNNSAKKRLLQLGESSKNIFVIGSPDIDLMLSNNLPSLNMVKKKYQIKFKKYAICIYHPVTTDLKHTVECFDILISKIREGKENYIIIYPNNDFGQHLILQEMLTLKKLPNVKLIPSMRIEYFITLLKNSHFLIGNSSLGIRGCPVYGIPSINISSRQKNRYNTDSIINLEKPKKKQLSDLIDKFYKVKKIYKKNNTFGKGDSAKKFSKVINSPAFWNDKSTQKIFKDI